LHAEFPFGERNMKQMIFEDHTKYRFLLFIFRNGCNWIL